MRKASNGRKASPKEVVPWLVIACEGGKTEPGYFEGARMSIRAPKARVRVLQAKGSDPLSVVESAIAEGNLARREVGPHPDAEVWAVFDGDEHRVTAQQQARWREALDVADRAGVRLAISNPSFELWYLLHYQTVSSSIHRDEAIRRLRDHRPDYEKADALFLDLGEARRRSATDQAKALTDACLRDADRTAADPYRNPSTRVHELVAAVLARRGR
jgi:hypothetical protein